MKFRSGFLVYFTLLPFLGIAQTVVEDGCEAALFGLDGDIYSNSSQFGNIAGSTNTDDWFANPNVNGTGIGVIETTFTSIWGSGLVNGDNTNIIGGMAYPPNTIINGVRLQDAIYARDYFGGPGFIDTTSYIQASKNGEDPAIWDTGIHNVTPKNDLIDCYGHLRRDGLTAYDNLWLYAGFSRISNNGSSYFDVELYAQILEYDQQTGFSSAGPDEGHTSWEFDNAGNITKVGDLVLAVVFSTGEPPEIDLRIWVSRFDFQNTNPATFDFGTEFDGGFNQSFYGYASVKAPIGQSIGCGLGNDTPSAAPPWGTLNSSGEFSTTYDQYQFVEIGVDLTVFGVDPAASVSSSSNPCWNPFANMLFKSRSSASFSSQLKDFSGPYPFGDAPVVPPDIKGDTITCYEPIAVLQPDSSAIGAYYHWSTDDGNIISNPDSSHVFVDEPGTYYLHSALMDGCTGDLDTFYVPSVIMSMEANILGETNYDCNIQSHLIGSGSGDTFIWEGPEGFTSNDSEVFVTTPGTYVLEVFDSYTGCGATDTILVSRITCEDIEIGDIPADGNISILLDTIQPTYTIPDDITLDCNGDPYDLSVTGEATEETDNCDPTVGEATYSDVSLQPCPGSTIITRTWTLTDACINELLGEQIITLTDTIPPSFTPPDDITIDCTENPNDLSLVGDVTDEADNCTPILSEAIFQDSIVDICIGTQIIYRNWILTDACGNEATGLQVINVIDNTPPTLTLPPAITIECDLDETDLDITGYISNPHDDCSPISTEPIFIDAIIGDNYCDGSAQIYRTWGFEDDCGNIYTGIQFITLEDTTPPIFTAPADLTVECGSENDLSITGDVIDESDNCDSNIGEATYTDILDFSCGETAMVIRTWMLEDICGNVATEVQIIHLEDTEPPTFTVPADVTLDCSQDPNDLTITGDVTDEMDACSDNIGEATYSDVITETCPSGSVITRTWSLNDECDNGTTAVQTITIEDTTPPTFTVPEDITIECDIDPTDLDIVGGVYDEMDNCNTNIGEATYTDVVNANTPCDGASTIVRTWTLDDGCGNETTAVQNITLEDTTPPFLNTFATNPIIECDSVTIPEVGVDLLAIDNCDPDPEATYEEEIVPGSCPDSYKLIRRWTAVDDCGNVWEYAQELYIEDTSTPVVVSFPDDVTIECDDPVPPYEPMVTDNCDAMIDISFTENTVYGPCANDYTVERTWSWADNCGNAQTHIQYIYAFDSTPPSFTPPADITIECDQDENEPSIVGEVSDATDNCDNALEPATYTDEVFSNTPCSGARQIVRTWLVSDDCGNTSTAIQVITLEDTTPPTFTVPADITIDCSIDPNDLTVVGDVTNESDECDPNIGEATYVDTEMSSCSGGNVITRTWTLTDGCGNESTAEQLITLEDTTPPTFSPPADITIECDQDPLDLVITGNVIDEADNCDPLLGEATFTDVEVTSPGCSYNKVITRTWILSDGCGNETTHDQIITIEDTTPPEFTISPTDITLDCSDDPTDLDLTGDVINEFDNCDSTIGEAIYTDVLTPNVPCVGSSSIIRTWTLSDECGNTTEQIQNIVLLDTTAPTFTTPDDITISCEIDPDNLSFTGDVTDEDDDCDTTIGEAIYNDIFNYNDGCLGTVTITRIWELKDACNNSMTAEQVITLVDTTSPTFTPPADLTISCSEDPNDLDLVGDVTDEADNCSPYIGDAIFVDSIAENQPCTGASIIWRTWTLIDACDNNTSLVQTIVIEDTTPPYFTLTFQDMTVECDNIPEPFNTQAADDCSDATVVLNESIAEGECVDLYVLNRTWTATDGCGNTATYNQAISVYSCGPDVEIITPDNMKICQDDAATFEVSVGPEYDTPNYQWQFSNDGGNTWTNITGANGSVYTIPSITASDGGFYRCLVANDAGDIGNPECTSYSEEIELVVLPHAPPHSYTDYICDGDEYYLGDLVYTEAGTYSTTIASYNGCDSLVNLELIVHPVYNTAEDQFICIGDTLFVGGSFYTEAGSYLDTVSTYYGCDSVLNTNLTIIYPVEDSIEVSICLGENFFAGGDYQTQPGRYIDTLASFTGCDSIAITNLIVNLPTETTIDTVLCEGESITIGTSTYSDAGSYIDSLLTYQNCDSVVFLNLLLNPVQETNLVEEICQGESFTVGQNDYSAAGTYSETLTTYLGCDSIVNLELILLPHSNYNQSFSICEGDSYFLGGADQTEAGIYYDTLTNYLDCDSVVISELIILQPSYIGFEWSICEGDSILVEGNYYTEAGIVYDTLTAFNGCDSIITTEISINISSFTSTTETICSGESFVFEGVSYTEPGIYTVSYPAYNGCDSTIAVELLLANNPITNIEETLCLGETYTAGGDDQTTDGVYIDTLMTYLGCDSFVYTTLTFISYSDYLEQIICIGDSVLIAGSYQTETGIYSDTLQSAEGCDSIIVTNLEVLQSIIEFTDESICLGDSIVIAGTFQSQAGIYSDTLASTSGCDSIVITELNLIPFLTEQVELEICIGDSILIGGNYESFAGVYVDTFPSTTCDSIVITNLTVLNPDFSSGTEAICEGDSILIANNYVSEAGVYYDTLTNIDGCDSLVATNLSLWPNYNDTLYIDLCEGERHFAEGANQTAAGTYLDAWQTINGCDSTLVTIIEVHPIYEETNSQTICAGDSTLLNGTYYFSAGTYTFTYTTSYGCDSIVHEEILTIPIAITNEQVQICDGDSIMIAGTFQSISGIYLDTLTSIENCDSIHATELITVPFITEVVDLDICEGDSILIGSTYQSEAGIYQETYSSSNGCDSIVSYNLNYVPALVGQSDTSVCIGQLVFVGGALQDTPGLYYDTLQSVVNGCDSIHITELIWIPNFTYNSIVEICPEDSIFINGNNELLPPGTYYDTLYSSTGCDTIHIIELQLRDAYQSSATAWICPGDSILLGNQYQFNPGTYVDTIASIQGCDSIITTELFLHPTHEETYQIEICSGSEILVAGDYQTTPGIYIDTLQSSNGCDSLIITELYIIPTVYEENDETICVGDSTLVFGTYQSTEGVYLDTLVRTNGCDSIAAINLIVLTEIAVDVIVDICTGDSHYVGGANQTEAGTYFDTLSNAQGCDSIIITELQVVSSFNDSTEVTICDGDSFFAGGANQTMAGTYIDSYTTLQGCDSLVYTILEVVPFFLENEAYEICEGEEILIGGVYQNSNGTYTDTLTSQAGCDSIIVIDLNVLPTQLTNFNSVICAGEGIFIEDDFVQSAGTFTDTLTTYNGCDSVVIYTIEVLPLYEDSSQMVICVDDFAYIGGNFYNSPGFYVDSLTSIHGCDSIVTIELLTVDRLKETVEVEICEGESHFAGGANQTVAGTYIDSFTSGAGCDSSLTTILIVHPIYSQDTTVYICDNESYYINGSNQTTAGNYTESYQTIHGCDSIINIELILWPTFTENFSYEICPGDSVQIYGEYITNPGIYTDFLSTINGCDSTIISEVLYREDIAIYVDLTICENDSVQISGVFENEAGIYSETIPSATGCDSTIVTTLEVVSSFYSTENLEICLGDSILINGIYQSETGNYYDTLTSLSGCDSIVLTQLSLLDFVTEDANAVICEGDSIFLGGIYHTQAGVYLDTLVNANGCDSIFYMAVNVEPSIQVYEEATLCDGETYMFNGDPYTSEGVYTSTFTSYNGCDSIVTLDLRLRAPSMSTLDTVVCSGQSVQIGTNTYNFPGTYTNTITAENGCDSIVTLNLVMLPPASEIFIATICQGGSYAIGGEVFTETGIYINTFTNTNGCDSIVTLDLFVEPAATTILNENICLGDSIFAGGAYQYQSGIYYDTLMTSFGCDSIIVTELDATPSITETLELSICDGDSILINGQFESSPGIFTQSFTTSSGCDSVVYTNLTIRQYVTTYLEYGFCIGDSLLVGDTYETQPGIYIDTLVNNSGCDSIIITEINTDHEAVEFVDLSICPGESILINGNLETEPGVYIEYQSNIDNCDSTIYYNLSILNPDIVQFEQQICEGGEVTVGTTTYYSEGSYATELTNMAGCDSIVIVTITVVDLLIEEQDQELCFGETFAFGGNIYDSTGIYVDTFLTVLGCDSLSILNLVVNDSISTLVDETICIGSSITVGGNIYDQTGTYVENLTAYNGCDSIVTIVLDVVDHIFEEVNDTICEGESIIFDGTTYTDSGTYSQTYTSAAGCDSTMTVNLTVLLDQEIMLSEVICEGESFEMGGLTYTTTGNYSADLISSYGCDSTVILDLLVLENVSTNDSQVICYGDSYTFGGVVYDSTGIYIDTLMTYYGCDSIATLDLVVNDSISILLDETICQGSSVTVGGTDYDQTGTYVENLTAYNGCDSIVTIVIDVVDHIFEEVNDTICEGEFIIFDGITYTDSGTYSQTYTSAAGCDSTMTVNLTVLLHQEINLQETICEGESFIVNGTEYTNTGNYSIDLTSSNGCDSTIILDLLVLENVSTNDSQVICYGDSYTFGGVVYDSTGTYIDTLMTYYGCDSIATLDLVVNDSISILLDETICEGSSITVGGTVYDQTGTYIETLTSHFGCDSIVTLTLEVVDHIEEEMDESICEGESYEMGGTVYTDPGTYSQTYESAAGCDSTMTLNLTVLLKQLTELQDTICEGDIYLLDGVEYTTSGSYSTDFTGSNGCDSTVVVDLFVIETVSSSIDQFICPGDSLLIGNTYQNETGTYIDTLISLQTDCDSLVFVSLTVYDEYEFVFEEIICEDDSILINGYYYNEDTVLVENYNTINGCDSTIIYEVIVDPITELFTDGGVICLGEEIQLFAEGTQNVQWSPSDGLSCDDCIDPIASPEETTVYTVTAESCLGEIVEAYATIVVNYPPDLTFEIDGNEDNEILLGDTVLLIANTSDLLSEITIYSEFGDTLCRNCTQTLVSPEFNTTYYATAINTLGCQITEELNMGVDRDCVNREIFAPNFITPNNDGRNDVFEVRYEGVKSVSLLRIYNRWGELVFETTDISSEKWDGTFRGTLVNPGVFVYYLEGVCLNEQKFLYKGNITVIR